MELEVKNCKDCPFYYKEDHKDHYCGVQNIFATEKLLFDNCPLVNDIVVIKMKA
jgi:hypothetical protein